MRSKRRSAGRSISTSTSRCGKTGVRTSASSTTRASRGRAPYRRFLLTHVTEPCYIQAFGVLSQARTWHSSPAVRAVYWPHLARETLMPPRRLDVVIDSVRRLLRIGATANLLNLLQKQHPADLAQVFGELAERDRLAAFSVLVERSSRLAMEALSELGPEPGAALLANRPAEEIARLMQELPSDDAAALLDYLPEELANTVIDLMRRKEGAEVESLLEYEENTAGRIMNPHVFALTEDLTVGEAISELQRARDVEMVFYLYVVDPRRHLVGVVSLRRLLLVSPETPLKRIMSADVTSARVDTDQEEVAQQVASYNLLAMPVVDHDSKLVGVITVDDVIDVIKDEATEDIYRLAGVSGDERVSTPVRSALKKRMLWLGVNLVMAFIASAVVALFREQISKVAVLAALMPIVAGMGGNAGTQTLAVVVRGLALGELTWANTWKALLKEVTMGVGNGLVIGSVAGVCAWLLFGNPWLGIILLMAMVVNMLVAGAAGTLIPLGLKALKIDPALASSIFITTFTDVFGFLTFLGLGAIFLDRLL
ncbi:MAG: magnesium transporter [Luteitalea sp.]|nr:magnesium transporter [Luteitalea sp.]